MKKIYTLAAGLILFGSITAQTQNPFNTASGTQAGKIAPNSKKAPVSGNTAANRAAGAFSQWVEPIGDIMTNSGVDVTGGAVAPAQDWFLAPVYMDSTVQVSSTSNRVIDDILLGSVLDPKSTGGLNADFSPICTKSDTYVLDSIGIFGSYVKKTPSIDTLYTWVIWGDSSNTAVFTKKLTNSVWVAPISTWRTSVIGPKITGAIGAVGNKVKAAAPATNMRLIKQVLTSSDSSQSGYSKWIDINVGTPITVPAGNIVSCFYTLVPGGTHTLGASCYTFTGGSLPQTTNGFAGIVWGQVAPAVAAVTDYANQQVDPAGWNMGIWYSKKARHAIYSATYQTMAPGDLVSAPYIAYKISGTSTESVNELNNNFSLGQNVPNPFTNQTKVNYQIKTAAKSVSFEIFNVAGVKMFDQSTSNVAAGNYSVNVNDVDFASGIYFYSLTVDGNKVTKKMVVTK